MSKVKAPKVKGIPSKHLHARTTFLYQAATYLTLKITPEVPLSDSEVSRTAAHTHDRSFPNHCPLALQLGSDLQQVSRKAQLRLSVDLKRTMCKRCNTVLVHGRTATQTIENTSKDGKKPWADVLVLRCKLCGGNKRFPVGAKKQPKKKNRETRLKDTTSTTSLDDVRQTNSAVQTSTDVDSITG
jgi:ribonuclease P protein subunit RPR2